MAQRRLVHPLLKNNHDIEFALTDYSYRQKQIIALKKKNDDLKDALVGSYFNDCDEYIDCNGIILATYKQIARTGINSDKLKTDLPEVWAEYQRITQYMKFEVK